MSNVYDSLKGTLQWSKANSMTVARVKGSDASSLDKEMEQLEKIVLDRLGRLRAAFSSDAPNKGPTSSPSGTSHTASTRRSARIPTASGPPPNARCASTAAMNGSRSPSSTSDGADEVTPVRRSFTI